MALYTDNEDSGGYESWGKQTAANSRALQAAAKKKKKDKLGSFADILGTLGGFLIGGPAGAAVGGGLAKGVTGIASGDASAGDLMGVAKGAMSAFGGGDVPDFGNMDYESIMSMLQEKPELENAYKLFLSQK